MLIKYGESYISIIIQFFVKSILGDSCEFARSMGVILSPVVENEPSATWNRVVQRCSLAGIFCPTVVYKVQLSIQCRPFARAVPFDCPTYLHASIVRLHIRKSLYSGASLVAWTAYNADRSRITCRREITCSDFTVRASAYVTLREVSYIMFYLVVYTVTHERSTYARKVANFQASLSLFSACVLSLPTRYTFFAQDENRLYVNTWMASRSLNVKHLDTVRYPWWSYDRVINF